MIAAPAAEAACGGAQHFWPTHPTRSPPPLAVGDSVMMAAAGPLGRAGFEVDVRGCRQMSEGLSVLSARRRTSSLPRVVVIALGYNSTISTAEVRGALRILGTQRVLGMVTPRGPMASTRAAIATAARRWPGRVMVLDWAARSEGKAWTWDGMHLTDSGARGFARLLSDAHEWPMPGKQAEIERAQPLDGGPGGGAIAP